ncbi:threonine synthase [Halobacteriales archaeon QS_1_68_17]|nr:MAG: threonine synthase [Halobacteriales archaeon QS_1_68_17]
MLVCESCGAEYPDTADGPWRCDCGHALDFAGRPTPDSEDPPAVADLETARGLWAFADLLPVAPRVTLGEGWTPLVDAPAWDARFKLEYVFPTGSFKDRGATTTLSRAVELGVDRVVEDSSGNAGAAVATYAARAGIDAGIYVPADAKASKVRAIERTGADVIRVEGDRAAVSEACIEAVERGAGWYASHAWNPAFFAGTETFAVEVAAQRGWTAPDAVVLPVGHGTLLLGAYRGFRLLSEAGWIDRVPRLFGAQAAGVAPVAARLGDEGTESSGGGGPRNDLADGVQVARPARLDQLVAAVEATGGDAVALDAAATRRELDRLRRAGFGVEATCALAPAALRRFRERGALDAGTDVVVALTGRA